MSSMTCLVTYPCFSLPYTQTYGEGGLKASRLQACELLPRLYWYTVEFGPNQTSRGPRADGAGILSSAGELPYSVNSSQARRNGSDLPRVMRTRYKIDSYQASYFVYDSFDPLFDTTAQEFEPIYAQVKSRTRHRRR
jgi:phenylalanine-4-hydroxylase